MTRFKDKTNGSHMVIDPPQIEWNFFGADSDWGQKQAAQLVIELEASLAQHDIKVLPLAESTSLSYLECIGDY